MDTEPQVATSAANFSGPGPSGVWTRNDLAALLEVTPEALGVAVSRGAPLPPACYAGRVALYSPKSVADLVQWRGELLVLSEVRDLVEARRVVWSQSADHRQATATP